MAAPLPRCFCVMRTKTRSPGQSFSVPAIFYGKGLQPADSGEAALKGHSLVERRDQGARCPVGSDGARAGGGGEVRVDDGALWRRDRVAVEEAAIGRDIRVQHRLHDVGAGRLQGVPLACRPAAVYFSGIEGTHFSME